MRVPLAVVAIVSAVFGGLAALGIGNAAGWLGEDGDTIVLQQAPEDAGRPEPTGAHSTAKPLQGNGFDPGEIYRTRAGGVVTIDAFFEHDDEETRGAQGSGFVVSSDGYILTNSHVITSAGATRTATAASDVYVEFQDGDRVEAEIVGWDVFDDVGVLRVDPEDHPLNSLPLGDSSQVTVGEPVVAIGSPFGNDSSLTVGVVSATRRAIPSLTSSFLLIDAIQTDAPINHGNSGGPLFDARGRVIGLNAQIRTGDDEDRGGFEGVGFAVPINSAKRSMEQLIATGEVRYAYVGIGAKDVTPNLAREFDLPVERGAIIEEVRDGSAGERAGLRGCDEVERFHGRDIGLGGDLIVALDGRPVRSADDVVRLVTERYLPGQVAKFTVYRGNERRTFSVRMDERPVRAASSGAACSD